jgi:hypothetical protein
MGLHVGTTLAALGHVVLPVLYLLHVKTLKDILVVRFFVRAVHEEDIPMNFIDVRCECAIVVLRDILKRGVSSLAQDG